MKASLSAYAFLFGAIICETFATSFMKQSEQFTRLVPSIITVLGYAAAFYLLSVTLKSLPVGVAYAVWSGLGIVLITLIGVFVFKQHLDFPAYLGMGMIIGGVLVMNIFSRASVH